MVVPFRKQQWRTGAGEFRLAARAVSREDGMPGPDGASGDGGIAAGQGIGTLELGQYVPSNVGKEGQRGKDGKAGGGGGGVSLQKNSGDITQYVPRSGRRSRRLRRLRQCPWQGRGWRRCIVGLLLSNSPVSLVRCSITTDLVAEVASGLVVLDSPGARVVQAASAQRAGHKIHQRFRQAWVAWGGTGGSGGQVDLVAVAHPSAFLLARERPPM